MLGLTAKIAIVIEIEFTIEIKYLCRTFLTIKANLF